MARIDVVLETGSKRVFASALEWPGWARGAKTEDQAIQALMDYATRYARVASRAGLKAPTAKPDFEIVERLRGDASTDYGVPAAVAAFDAKPASKASTDKMCALVEACWAELDHVAKGAPQALRKGPRGGGRDRDKIVEHVVGAECSAYAPKLGLKLQQPAIDDRKAIVAYRKSLLEAFREGASGKPLRERGWPVRYAARRIAWHVLDHAWEIEDRSEG